MLNILLGQFPIPYTRNSFSFRKSQGCRCQRLVDTIILIIFYIFSITGEHVFHVSTVLYFYIFLFLYSYKHLLFRDIQFRSVVSVGMNVLLSFFMHVLIVLMTDSYRNVVVIVVSILTLLGVSTMLVVSINLQQK